METFNVAIQNIITENYDPNLGSLFTLTHSNEISIPDESGIRYYTWYNWRQGLPETEEQELQRETLEQKIISEIEAAFIKYADEPIINQDGYMHYEAPKGDFVRVHFSDSSIHLIEFNSGQY